MRARVVLVIVGLVCVTAAGSGWAQNILANPGFEEGGKASAAGWLSHVARGDYRFGVEGEAHGGERCVVVACNNAEGGWARWFTTDVYLLAGAKYRVTAWVRTAGGGVCQVVMPLGEGAGDFSVSTTDAAEWTRLQGEFTAAGTGRHGLYLQNLGPGSVWYDDVTVELVAAPPPAPGEPVPTDGDPLTAIVTPDAAGPHHVYLALELQRILREMTGVSPGLLAFSAAAPRAAAERMLWVGCKPPGRSYDAQLAEAGSEGIVLDVGPEAVVCLGGSARGEYYAVHELLYLLGCRWAWPGPNGEALPRVERLTLPTRLVVHRPSYTLRGGHFIQAFHTPPDYAVRHCDPEAWVDWAARNRMNRLKPSYATTLDYGAIRGGQVDEIAGHSLYHILPPEKWFATRPDFYPLVGGKRTAVHSSGRAAEICVTAPGVVEAVAEYACDFFASHPSAMRFCINAEDEPSYWCECEACKALDPVPQDWSQNGVECQFLTDRWLHFINAVAQIVERQYPDKLISTFAYGSTREFPLRERPRRNVGIELTVWDQCFKHAISDPACTVNAKGVERFRQWSQIAPLALYRYLDYWHLESPCAGFHAEADSLRSAYAGGCRMLSDEWDATFNASPLLLNLRARLEWDVNTDVDAFIRDWCASVYGPAGEVMERHYRRLERGVMEQPVEHTEFTGLERFSPEVLRDGHALLDEATALAGTDEVQDRIDRQRFALLFAELEQVSNLVATQPELYPRQAELQEQVWGIVQKRNLDIVVGHYGKLGREYKPPVAALAARRVLELPEMWMFRTDPGNVGEGEGWQSQAPDANWVPLSTRKCWEEQGFGGYDGYAWYTVEVEVAEIAESRVWLVCEAVDETFELWINGEHVGGSDGDPGVLWDKPVAVDISGKLKAGEMNRITMRVHDMGYAGGIWKAMWVTGG